MVAREVEDTVESKAGSPSSWSIHPCDDNTWSNDYDEFDKMTDEKGNLLVPCPTSSSASGQRPLSDAEKEQQQEQMSSSSPSTGAGASSSTSTSTTTSTITSAAGEDDKDAGKLILDGRPGGFRPGVEVVNKATADPSDNTSVSSFSTTLSGGATAGVVVGALAALVIATIFLVARKRHRQDNGNDQATLIAKGAAGAAAVVSDDIDDDALNATTVNDSFESEDGAHPIDADDSDAILADIESFGGHRLSSSAMVGAMMATTAAASTLDNNSVTSTNFNRSNNRSIELDPEAAAAYLAGGRVAAAAVATKRRDSNADLEAQEDDMVKGSDNNPDNLGKIDFVPSTTDDIDLADGTKSWLAKQVVDCCNK